MSAPSWSAANTQGEAATGAGGGTGFEYINIPQVQQNCPAPPFLKVSSDRFILNHTGTYDAVDADGRNIAAYVGPTTVDIRVGQHVISPEGTYLCVEQNGVEVAVPAPVPILHATVNGTTRDPITNAVTGSVSCSSTPTGESAYERRGGEAVIFTFRNNSCTIDGNVGVDPGPVVVNNVRHVIEGTLTPCAIVPFDPNSPQNPACQGAPVEPDPIADPQQGPQPPSGFLTTTYQAEGPSPA